MGKRIMVKHKPTGELYTFDLDNPPKDGVEKVLFAVALNKQDMILKKPNIEMYLKFDDLEVEELAS